MDRQERILKAAEQLFGKKGFDGVAVVEIARKANTSKSLVFHHFKTKQCLIEAIVKSKLLQIENVLEKILKDENKNPEDKIKSFVDTYLLLIEKNLNFYRILIRETLNQRKPVSGLIVEHNLKLINEVSDVINEGISLNIFKSEIDPHLTAFTIVNSINAFAAVENLKKTERRKFSVERKMLASHLKNIFLEGMRA